MTPGDLGQLATTFGPTTAILLVMYLNRKPDAAKPGSNPISGISERLERMENAQTRILTILEERK